ncbi:SDR family NAD(P)-dependent oxidoreductase [Jiangella mangrovi]|uniref:NAD(P)-dependent dehydrogenase (Short-subunit alcohol dehydrogenase family) n=1 Tax=Jiangella mangrovi TaxID=1524084 RepID=A0A7W9GST0_9ACTN|nr:SDR family oxidoreductase [Jiangella mangrovi]MBB5789392.1 NAD(P)-dependent dehydrogenase (short-subunit alcohol dehydrogenase family) [Jiangella mangrovi]
MLLEHKTAIVYGGGGAVGGAVARAFAREGAVVHLAGRTRTTLDAVADDIRQAGGTAATAVVDALDQDAVDAHAAAVVAETGRLDVSFNGVGDDNGEQGVPLVELTADQYVRPVAEYARTHFVTARAAARHMAAQGSGVILPLSNPMAGSPAALTGPFGQACAAVENLARQLAAELGPRGIRVVCLRPTGMPETATRLGSHTREVWTRAAERLGMTLEEMLPQVAAGSPLGRALTVADVAEVAAFVASDRAAGMTGTVANVTGGAVAD